MKKSSKSNRIEQEDSKIRAQNDKTLKFLNKFDYIFITLLLVIIITIILLSTFDTISWQLSSIGRILLIKILPYFDWRYLKNEQCLVKGFSDQKDSMMNTLLECSTCEDMDEIHVREYLEEEVLEERYINIDIPVILTKNLNNYPNNSKFFQDLIKEERFHKSYPCYLVTNIFKGIADLETILSKLKYFETFFIHFQNCEMESMRTFRKYIFRPDVLPSIYSPTLYNWLIWNKNYNTTNYKRVQLVEKVTLIAQLFGSTYIRLIPRKNCENVCPFLSVRLQHGDILIFSSLWDLEYRPNETGENMAVVMEYRE